MRIAVWHNLPSGGGKRALYNHVRGLLALGHTVESWCPPTASQAYLPLGELVPEHVTAMDWPETRTRSDYLQLTLHTGRKLDAMDAHCRRCAEEMERGGFDVLFANSCMFFRTTPIGRHAQLPSVLYLQEPYRWLYEAMPDLCWWAPDPDTRPWWNARKVKRTYGDLLQQRNLRLQARRERDDAAAFGRILVNSQFSRESVLRAYGLDSTVCYLGIDHDQFGFSEHERGNYIVSLGSITPEKNACFIVEAIGQIEHDRPTLTWIGNFADGSYADKARALASERDVELEFLVNVSDQQLQDVLGRALAMAYAPRLEPFGLAPLEANACGTPAVAVAEGGVRETVVDGVTGLLVDSDPASMARAIVRLQTTPGLARQLGRQAREAVVTRWSMDEATRRLDVQLARIVGQAGTSKLARAAGMAGPF